MEYNLCYFALVLDCPLPIINSLMSLFTKDRYAFFNAFGQLHAITKEKGYSLTTIPFGKSGLEPISWRKDSLWHIDIFLFVGVCQVELTLPLRSVLLLIPLGSNSTYESKTTFEMLVDLIKEFG